MADRKNAVIVHEKKRKTRPLGNWPMTYMPEDSFETDELADDMKPSRNKNPFNWAARLIGADQMVCPKCDEVVLRKDTWNSTPKNKRHPCFR